MKKRELANFYKQGKLYIDRLGFGFLLLSLIRIEEILCITGLVENLAGYMNTF